MRRWRLTQFIHKLCATSGLMALLAVSGATAMCLVPSSAFAATAVSDACGALDAATGSGMCTRDQANKRTRSIIQDVVNILSIVVGAVSVIMIIIGGFRYVVSNGDSNGLQGAKNTILYAIVGLIVVLFAQIIVRFVASRVT